MRLGGKDQAILIRAASPDKPVLLYLSGGPGQRDLGWSRVYFGELTRDFVVVGWDQHGTGKSFVALDPTDTWTLEQAVSDTVELTNYLRGRVGAEKIYLMAARRDLIGVVRRARGAHQAALQFPRRRSRRRLRGVRGAPTHPDRDCAPRDL